MKMNLKNIIFILGVLFLGSSCENFLDVHPKGEVTGKELLKDRKGFENALYGVYATMRNQTLYGRYLSYLRRHGPILYLLRQYLCFGVKSF